MHKGCRVGRQHLFSADSGPVICAVPEQCSRSLGMYLLESQQSALSGYWLKHGPSVSVSSPIHIQCKNCFASCAGDEFLGHQSRSPKHMTIYFNTFILLQIWNEFNARKLAGETNVFAGFWENSK